MSNKRLVLLLATAIACLAVHHTAYCAVEPWYNDMRGHWAEPYVRVLWEEGVTDGYIPSVDPNVAKYWPQDYSTRAQLAVLLQKVFGLPPAFPEKPTYPDVPKHYLLFWNKPAWHLIEGAFLGGIIFVPSGAYFCPDNKITREDAVELLIRALDLEEYASSVPPAELDTILRRFYDWRYVAEVRQPSMACAIKLGIIQGYEDGSLRPGNYLARGEAATVVARSCMIRMVARGESFSPDGDGFEDVATFDLSYLKNRGIVSWQAAIQDGQGRPIKDLALPGTPGQPPLNVTWDGRTNDGLAANPGTYYYQALVTDVSRRQHVSVRRPLLLTRHSLSAWVQPASCIDGRTLTVSARTEPAALSVTATFVDGVRRSLSANGTKTYWEVSMVMGPFLPVGSQSVAVEASFADAIRLASPSFTRVPDLWLDPSVSPNPASWGQTLTLICRTSPVVISAAASLFGESVELALAQTGMWMGTSSVPWGADLGQHPVSFTVTAPSGSLTNTIALTVDGPDTSGISYVLTK